MTAKLAPATPKWNGVSEWNGGPAVSHNTSGNGLPRHHLCLVYPVVKNRSVSALRKKILVVDDDPATRESIRLLLDVDRHTVTEASNGYEALELFKGQTYDLVITDYLMPGMLGDELARSIRSIAPAQPILMVTAYVEKLLAAGLPPGAMLGKPWSIDDLRQAVAMAGE